MNEGLTLDQNISEEKHRQPSGNPLVWLLWALIVFLILFGCGSLAMLVESQQAQVEIRPALQANYGVWPNNVQFGAVNPGLLDDIVSDRGFNISRTGNVSDDCFIPGSCTTFTPTASPFPSATPTVTNTPTVTQTPTPSSTPTITPPPTNTPTVTNTSPPPTNTPTPTPQVYPIKLANPQNIPPGPTTVQFRILVINYGSIPPAHLTRVIDRLPPGMEYDGGCVPACPGTSIGDTVIDWSGLDIWINQNSYYLLRFNASADGNAGDVFENQVETQGGNFETAVNVKRVYVYTPTPTSTPSNAPVAVNDPTIGAYNIDEDNSLSLSAPGVLANDSDDPWDQALLEATLFSPASNGSAIVNLDGSILYTPATNYFGPDNFAYEVCDPGGLCDQALVSITINSVEDVPEALDDNYSVNEDATMIVSAPGVLVNDTDGDPGDSLTTTRLTDPSNGSVTYFNSDGSFEYQPDAHYFGPDQFTYEACDPDGDCDTATVLLTVISVNDAPVAVNDPENISDPPYETNEDVALSIDVLVNDYDPIEGDLLTISSFPGAPAHGSLAIDQNGTPGVPYDDLVRYTPALHYFGNDSFTYRISDGNGGFDDAVVRVLVNPVNDAPTAVNDSATMGAFDLPIPIDVMANDADLVEGEPLQITAVQDPSVGGGIVTIDDNGTPGNLTDDFIVYAPNGYSDPAIPDTFTYTISDGQPVNNTDTATVSIIVNDAPNAVDDNYTVDEDTVLIVPGIPATYALVLDNDTDPNSDSLLAILTTQPANGTVLPFGSDGSFTYQPDLHFNGTDTFTYDACDGLLVGLCDAATVTITVNSINDDPVAVDDSLRANYETSTVFDLLANDTDVDLDTLTISNVENSIAASHGSVTNNGTDVTYDPDAGYIGNDSFSYTIDDGNGGAATAIVSVLVSGYPTAEDDSYTTQEDTPLIVAAPGVLGTVGNPGYDSDPNPTDTLTAAQVSGPSDGSLTLNPNGSFSYSPYLNFNGNDQFTYEACDPGGLCDNALVTITVVGANDPPITRNDLAITDEDTPVLIDLLADNGNGVDYDVDGFIDPTSVFISSAPASGSVINHYNGTVTYTPDADFLAVGGPDLFVWFQYTVDDNVGSTSSPATVTVQITPLNDPPTARDDNREASQDETLNISVLSNDYDIDSGDTFSIFSYDLLGSQGATITQLGGSLVYDPLPGFHDPINPENFTYTIQDSNGAFDSATVSVTVNDAPEAAADAVTTDEDVPVTIAVLANDTDINGDPVEISAGSVTSPTNGSVTINENGTPLDRTDDYIDYTPDADYHGPDSFTYQITDGGLDSSPATVDITVNSVNDDPVAQDDNERTNTGLPNTFDVLVNDSDVDAGDVISITSVTNGSHGTVSNNTTDVTYTPSGGFVGSDSFTYTIEDGSGGTATATVNVVVNGPPIAADDSFATNEDTALVEPIPGVMLGDTDPNSDPLSASKLSDPTHGTVSIAPDGSFIYTPTADYNGTDSFTYEVCDPGSPGQAQLCDVGNVTINISASPDAPLAVDDNYSVDEDGFLTISGPGVLNNDSDGDNLPPANPWDGLAVSLVAGPSHAAGFSLSADGSFSYTPTLNFNGSDSFEYEACDVTPLCDTATVFINVNSVNDDPIAQDDPGAGPAIITDEDTPIIIDVLANDSDPADGDTLTVASAGTGASFGSVVNNGGNVTYTPSADFLSVGQSQVDSFSYMISDGNGGTASADVTLTITGLNDNPIASDDNRSMSAFDPPLSISVLSNDSDPDAGDIVSINSFDTVSTNGAIVSQIGNDLVYDPNGYHHPTNPDTFGYLIQDGNGGSDSATVSVLVNDPPSASDDAYSVDEDNTLSVPAPGVLANDVEPNGDSLSVSLISGVSHGSVSLQGDGSFNYTPSANYFGLDEFSYRICDAVSGGTCDTASVEITVISVNDKPVATNNSGSANQVVASTTGITIDVASDDSDLEGAVLPASVAIASLPSHGTAVANGDGTITYTLTDGRHTTDSFTYTIQDDQIPGATSDPATVSITIAPPPSLQVEKEALPDTVGEGDTFDFLVYIWNDGPGTAYDVNLTDTLGSCFAWTSGNPGGSIGDLAEGEAVVRIAGARVVETSSCSNTNTAAVTAVNGASDSTTINVSIIPSGGAGAIPTPTPTPGSVGSTTSTVRVDTAGIEATFTLLIPVFLMVTPFLLAFVDRLRGMT